MTDDELEVWRRQWQGNLSVTVDLIRRVERETVEMRLGRLALLAPGAVGVGIVIVAALTRDISAILLAIGTWIFIGIGAWFEAKNRKGIWAPTSESTAAYLELSIERCRRTLRGHRYGRVQSPLITTFVLVGVYQMLKSGGGLTKPIDYWITAAVFLFTIANVAFVMFVLNKARKKTEKELEYLLNLQHELREKEGL